MTLNVKIEFLIDFFGDFGLRHNSIAFAGVATQLTRKILVFVY